MKILIHSLILAATVLLTYLWAGHPNLSHYTLQLVGILALTYVLLHKFTNRLYHPTGLLNLEGALFLTAITLLMVFSTGGASSPLFFVLYFLLFALSLLFEPVQTAILSLLLLPPLFLEISHFGQAVTPGTWGNLAALVLITPMAVVFGRKLIELQNTTSRPTTPPTKVWLDQNLIPTLNQTATILVQTIADGNLPTRLTTPLTQTYQNLKNLLEALKQLDESLDSPSSVNNDPQDE